MAATLHSIQCKAIEDHVCPFYIIKKTPLDDKFGTAITAFDILGRVFPPEGMKGRSEGTALGSSKHRLHSSVLTSPSPFPPIYTLRKLIPCVFSALCTRDQRTGPYPRIRILSRGGTPAMHATTPIWTPSATPIGCAKLQLSISCPTSPSPTRSPAIALQTLRNRVRLSDVLDVRGLVRVLPSPGFSSADSGSASGPLLEKNLNT